MMGLFNRKKSTQRYLKEHSDNADAVERYTHECILYLIIGYDKQRRCAAYYIGMAESGWRKGNHYESFTNKKKGYYSYWGKKKRANKGVWNFMDKMEKEYGAEFFPLADTFTDNSKVMFHEVITLSKVSSESTRFAYRDIEYAMKVVEHRVLQALQGDTRITNVDFSKGYTSSEAKNVEAVESLLNENYVNRRISEILAIIRKIIGEK